jgi:hypothetical protein
MKTADSIEQQAAQLSQSLKRKSGRGDGARIAKWQFKPGQSGNPGGQPKHDVSREIARAIFENNA